MTGTRYIGSIVTSRATVVGNLTLGGSILNEDGEYSSANSIGNVHGNVSIGEVGNITYIDNVDTITGNIGNISTIKNATNIATEHVGHIESIEASNMSVDSITTSGSMTGNIDVNHIEHGNNMSPNVISTVNTISTVGNANTINDVATIMTMEKMDTVMSVSDIDNVGNIGSMNQVTNIGTVTSIETADNVGTISTVAIMNANNVNTIEAVSNMTAVILVDDIDLMESGEIDNVGNINSANNIGSVGEVANMEATNIGTVTTIHMADNVGTIETLTIASNIGSVSDITSIGDNTNVGTVETIVSMATGHITNANAVTAANVASTISIASVVGTLDIDGSVDINTYSGSITNASGVYINQAMDSDHSLAVTGDAKIIGGLVVTGDIYTDDISLSSVIANVERSSKITDNISIDGNTSVLATGLNVGGSGTFRNTLVVGSNVAHDADVPLHVTTHHGGYPLITFENTYPGNDTPDKGSIGLSLKNTTQEFQIGAYKPTGLQFRANDITKMTMLTNGNLGVGTTDPTAKLDVNGTTRLGGAVTADANLTVNGHITSYAHGNDPIALFQADSASTRRFHIENVGGGAAMMRLISSTTAGDNGDWGISTRTGQYGTLNFYNYDTSQYRMHIHKDGNVRIGNDTTDPMSKFQVDGNIRATGEITSGGNITMSTSDTGWSGLRLRTTSVSTDWAIRTSSSGQLAIADIKNNRTLMTYDEDGNVGIGTTSPDAKLDVNGTTRLREAVTADANLTVVGTAYAYALGIGNGNPSVNVPLHVRTGHGGDSLVTFENTYTHQGTNDGSIGLELKNTEQTFQIGAYKQTGLEFRSGGDTRMTMLANGDLGIGTTSPTAKLDVDGTTRLRGAVTTNSELIVNDHAYSRTLGIGPDYVGSSGGNVLTVRDDSKYTTKLSIQNHGVGNGASLDLISASTQYSVVARDYGLSVYDQDASSHRLRLNTAGNLGIGTTSPAARLDVNGSGVFLNRLAVGTNVVPTADVPLHVTTSHGGYPMVTFENTHHDSSNPDNGSIGLVLRNTEQTFQIGAYKPTGLQFRGGNATRMTMLTNGNLGIGTTTPDAKLDVDGTTRLGGHVRIDGHITSVTTEINSGIRLQANSGGSVVGNWGILSRYDNGCLQFYDYTNSGLTRDRLVLTKEGRVGINRYGPSYELDVEGNINSRQNLYVSDNVGIGTTSPTAKLDVDGTTRLRGAITTDSSLTVNGRITSYTSSDETMALFQASHNDTRRFIIENTGGGAAMYRMTSGTNGDWGISTRTEHDGALTFYNYDTSQYRMHIHKDGNVRIGNDTTDPDVKLQVDGNIRATGEITSGDNITMSTSESGWRGLRLATTNNSDWAIRTSSSGQLAIADIKNNRTLMTYSETGNVGIGTTSPAAKLDVNGDIRSTNSIAHTNASLRLEASSDGSVVGDWGLVSRSDDGRLQIYDFTNTTSENNRIVLTKDGQVGINTPAPTAGLDVDGTTRLRGAVTTDSSLTVNASLSATSATNTSLRLQSTGGTGSNWGIISRTDGRLQFYDYSGTASVSDVMVLTNTGMVGINLSGPSYELDVEGNINSRQNLYVTSNVGIGTTSPTAKLDVRGNINTTGNLDVSENGTFLGRLAVGSNDVSDADVPLHVTTSRAGYPLITLENTYSDVTDGSIGLSLKNTEQTFDIGAYKPTGLQFRANGDTRMTMLTDGNLGIGTEAPTAKLDVSGNIRATGDVQVDGSISSGSWLSMNTEGAVVRSFSKNVYHYAGSSHSTLHRYGTDGITMRSINTGTSSVSITIPNLDNAVSIRLLCTNKLLFEGNGWGHINNRSTVDIPIRDVTQSLSDISILRWERSLNRYVNPPSGGDRVKLYAVVTATIQNLTITGGTIDCDITIETWFDDLSGDTSARYSYVYSVISGGNRIPNQQYYIHRSNIGQIDAIVEYMT